MKVVLVVGQTQRLTDSQALLIARLEADPAIELVGRVPGHHRRETRAKPWLLRAVLALEGRVMRHRILSFDAEPVQRMLARLPVWDAKDGEADLALVLGDHALRPDELGRVRHGEWALSYAGSPDPGWIGVAREVRRKPRINVDILVRTAAAPEPRVLCGTSYNPKPGAVLTGAFIAEKSALFLHHALKELADGQEFAPGEAAPMACPKAPGLAELLGYARAFCGTALSRVVERARTRKNRAREFWRIARGSGDVTGFSPKDATDLPVRRHIMADPFLFEHEGETWVFYEAMDANGGNGWIECARMTSDGMEASAEALRRPYHLSFPYVFRDGDAIYMIPETQQSQRLEVWRATQFPTEWSLHATAFEGQHLAESSLFRADDGQWWLLTNLSDHHAFQDHSSELYLFAVDGPDLKEITPHPRNPVVFGADVARNAGAVIRQNGRLFRPAQNNSFGVYGYGLSLMEISRLDGAAYEEQLVRSFTPSDKPGSSALHHLSAVGDQYVFDWGGR